MTKRVKAKKRRTQSRIKLEKPFCVIAQKAVNRSWFATEAEAIEHAGTLDQKKAEFFASRNGNGQYNTDKEPTTFAIVRVTAAVGPRPIVEPPVIVTRYR